MELILTGDSLDVGRMAINNWYSGTTNLWSADTGSNSIRTIAGSNRAYSLFGVSIGLNNKNSGAYATILNGSGNTITSGTLSLIGGGRTNIASNSYASIINGRSSTASGSKSFIGNGVTNIASNTYASVLNGISNTASGLRSVVVNGTSNLARSRNSFIGNGVTNTTSSVSTYYSCTVLNGLINAANAGFSTIINGRHNTTTGPYFGFSTIINGQYNTASGAYSLVQGLSCTAAYAFSSAIGNLATAGADYQMVFAAGAGNTIRLRYTDGKGSFEGGTDVGPADYAEYFEWADENPNNDKRFGYAVSLVENGKVQIGGKNIIGIVSSTPAVVGDSSELTWKEKYVTDEWGIKQYDEFKTFFSSELKKRIFIDKNNELYSNAPTSIQSAERNRLLQKIEIPENINFETVTLPRLNPDYDESASFIPRSQRKEWTTIGLLGKLRIRTAQKITSKFIDIDENGMAVNGTKYHVLKTIREYDGSSGIVLVFFK